METFGPKWVWLALDTVGAGLGLVLTFTDEESPGAWVLSVGFLAHMAWLLAGVVCIRDDAAFVRSWRGWAEPVLLDHVAAVSVRWRFLPLETRAVFAVRSLRVTDKGGAELTISPFRWRRGRRLAQRLLLSVRVDEDGADSVWAIDIDPETRERVDRLIQGW